MGSGEQPGRPRPLVRLAMGLPLGHTGNPGSVTRVRVRSFSSPRRGPDDRHVRSPPLSRPPAGGRRSRTRITSTSQLRGTGGRNGAQVIEGDVINGGADSDKPTLQPSHLAAGQVFLPRWSACSRRSSTARASMRNDLPGRGEGGWFWWSVRNSCRPSCSSSWRMVIAQRGLRDQQSLSGSGEVCRLGDRDERSQVPQLPHS